jgi:hypothetical protein
LFRAAQFVAIDEAGNYPALASRWVRKATVPTANSTLVTIACESADYLGDEGLVQLNLVRRGWLFAATDGAASRNPDPATPA